MAREALVIVTHQRAKLTGPVPPQAAKKRHPPSSLTPSTEVQHNFRGKKKKSFPFLALKTLAALDQCFHQCAF